MVLLLPFVDSARLLEAVRNHVDRERLSPEERKRNEFGSAFVFSYDATANPHAYPSPLPGLPDIASCHCKTENLPYLP